MTIDLDEETLKEIHSVLVSGYNTTLARHLRCAMDRKKAKDDNDQYNRDTYGEWPSVERASSDEAAASSRRSFEWADDARYRSSSEDERAGSND